MNAWDQYAAAIFSFSLAPKIVAIMVAVVLAIFFVSTMILRYHWREYGRDDGTMLHIEKRYLAGGVFFVLVIFASAVAYLI